jgi:hypothetical protein
MKTKRRAQHEHIRATLRVNGDLSAAELRASLGTNISQPTLSRLLADLAAELIVVGKGPRTRYALRRSMRGVGERWPVFRITESGTSEKLGELYALHQSQFYFKNEIPCDWLREAFQDGLFPDLPWFLSDLRPQGFLGRALARQVAPIFLCDPDPRSWSSDLCLHALLAFGKDLSGNLVIGDTALAAAQTFPATQRAVQLSQLPALAEQALRGEVIGSSAAGEQPKFGCWVTKVELDLSQLAGGEVDKHPSQVAQRAVDKHACLVKFSPPINSTAGRRWADLLACEAIADRLLGGTSNTIDFDSRRFLIAKRFDRVGEFGRRGLVSIGAPDTAYFGGLDNWATCATRLERAGWLSNEDANKLRLRYFFGRAIGNTDMHFGNASLVFSTTLPMALAPSYDMLPMLFAPLANGEVLARNFAMPTPSSDPLQNQAHALAQQFWTSVRSDVRISAEFVKVASDLLARW